MHLLLKFNANECNQQHVLECINQTTAAAAAAAAWWWSLNKLFSRLETHKADVMLLSALLL